MSVETADAAEDVVGGDADDSSRLDPKIDRPGVYEIPAAAYHRDPVEGGSLSSSGARLLLELPARFRYRQEHGEEHSDTFDVGNAAHKLVLGVGREIVVVDADNWTTKAAREAKAQAYAEGKTPLLPKVYEQVVAMADRLREHELAMALLDPSGGGKAEQTLVWVDEQSGVWCRAMLDWLPPVPESGRLILSDYKTTTDASGVEFGKSVANYGYHVQHAHNVAGAEALFPGVDVAFVFIAQEKSPPYFVNVVEIEWHAQRIGEVRRRRALEIYRRCRETGEWPGYGPDVERVSLPRWAELAHEDEFGPLPEKGF